MNENNVYNNLSEKDKKSLSINAIRQLEILSKYYDINYEEHTITIKCEFEKVSDILNSPLSTKTKPVIDSDFLEGISQTLHPIPEEFKLNFEIIINDYEGYDPKIIMGALQDSLEIFNYDLTKEKKKNTIKMSLLIFIGIFIFALLYYICSFNFIKDDVAHNTIHEIIYTVACVLLWEGVYILFLPDNSYNSINETLLTRINNFLLLDSTNKIVVKRNIAEIKKDWVQDGKDEKRAKRFLLFLGTGSMCIGAIIATDIIQYTKSFSTNPGFSVLMIIINILTGLFIFIQGVSAVCYYTNSGKLKNYLLLFCLISLFTSLTFLGLEIVNTIKNSNVNNYSLVMTCITVALNIATLISQKVLSKKNKEYLKRYN